MPAFTLKELKIHKYGWADGKQVTKVHLESRFQLQNENKP